MPDRYLCMSARHDGDQGVYLFAGIGAGAGTMLQVTKVGEPLPYRISSVYVVSFEESDELEQVIATAVASENGVH